MAFEHILLIDDNLSVVETTQEMLASAGFRVSGATNGLATITHPDIQDIDLILLDSNLSGENSEEICKMLKNHKKTFELPVMLLVDEDEVYERYSQNMGGADGYILKPFDQQDLISKINNILEEKHIKKRAEIYLREAAENHIQLIAEEAIQEAVDKRTRIIAEKSLQQIVKIVSQKADEEVNNMVCNLSEKKEQELVRSTVKHVAESMIENMVDRRIVEQLDEILAESTEKAVKNASAMIIPELAHEKIRHHLEDMLPHQARSEVEEATKNVVPEISNRLVNLVEEVADQSVNRVADTKLPSLSEMAVKKSISNILPFEVQKVSEQMIRDMVETRFAPLLRKKLTLAVLIQSFFNVLVVGGLIFGFYFLIFQTGFFN